MRDKAIDQCISYARIVGASKALREEIARCTVLSSVLALTVDAKNKPAQAVYRYARELKGSSL